MLFHFLHRLLKHKKDTPTKAAIVLDGLAYTYETFLKDALDLAGFLKARAPKGTACIIFSEKNLFFFQSVIACFFAKLIYTPLSLQAGFERNKRILCSIDNAIILVGCLEKSKLESLLSMASHRSLYILDAKTYQMALAIKPTHRIYAISPDAAFDVSEYDFDGNDIAYLLFTSGSTGVPKGVPISFRNINAYLSSILRLFQMHADDRFLQLSDVGFDISLHEMLVCWSIGGTLFVYPKEAAEPVSLYLLKHAITQIILIPSMLNQLYQQCQYFGFTLDHLKITFVCGEPFPLHYARAWHLISPQSRTINLYGPTEATVACTYHIFNPTNAYHGLSTVPIGYPLFGATVKLTDRGEMIISGDQVFAGYHTCGDTVNHYASGDIAYYDQRLGFVFQGRADDQWQVKGMRIEKSDIENILKTTLHDNDICVVAHKDAAGLVDYLLGFSLRQYDSNRYKKQLSTVLSSPLIPKKILTVREMPRLSNGKINYKTLETYL
jgi:D-alanine--poly(phosphoribitol) ligase subunit 1